MTALSALGVEAEQGQPARSNPWLFSPWVDVWTFGGSAALALLLLMFGAWAGWLTSTTPEWTWITGVLLVDVAHVYATAFRVYLIPEEFQRRPWLYGLTPVLAAALGWAVASESEPLFWRGLAYLAVFHFVRQQAGWVAWYRVRSGDRSRGSAAIDFAAIYLATLYPLAYWHAHLPRDFWWFLEGDFVALPVGIAAMLWPVYVVTLLLYAMKAVWESVSGRGQWGRDLVVVSTVLCWYVGIVALNSDYAFTVTNVFIHGIPYLVLTYWYARSRHGPPWLPRRRWAALVCFLATIWLLAYSEELLWDRHIWQERIWLFGQSVEADSWRPLLLGLLATPQLTHYLLDGFLWRRAGNPQLAAALARS